ncbi:hypothetical protein [Parachlamydia acanthamoebae]|jgi:hypothetical protein|uniref:hypothetical protein n=1 Tax=Parachlamydia acanthamoebae TaxID=83552 RepID=UPI0001C17911|nr:hypothetical protein [Parachlamydia acanthamoebae]EFB41004.1 hypothetical protein pah_c161o005 [Parachlamydia acanthamoebae str. Hall's coccus]
MRDYKPLIFSVLGLSLCFALPNHALEISPEQARQLGEQIWKNECKKSIAGLTSWNAGEEFASLGIGHFIWHPKGSDSPFKESFPTLIKFLCKQGIALPNWLMQADGCPWKTREEFLAAQDEKKLTRLRQLLLESIDLQIYFMFERLEKSLPILVENLTSEEQNKIHTQFCQLSESVTGTYALLDYVNFKGEGVSPQERYQGIGWGLRQVLLGMNPSSEPVKEFARSASAVLKNRVENSPPQRNEKRWLEGWLNRVQTYVTYSANG